MIKVGVGSSNQEKSIEAGAAACREAFAEVGGKADLVFVFSTVSYNQEEMLKGVNFIARGVPVVGCSTAGEITDKGPGLKSVAVMALKADKIKFNLSLAKGADVDSRKAGNIAARDVKKQSPGNNNLFVMLLDGLAENGAAAVRGAQEVFGKNFPIIGGSAGDDFLFKKTYQYFNGEVQTGAVVGIGLSGDFSFGLGVRHGWEPVGLPMRVTKAQGAKLIEVNNRPALKVYEDCFGKKAEDLIRQPIARMAYTYPLGMKVEGSPEFLLRDALYANKKGELICAAEIPQGAEIRLMIGDADKAIEAAEEAAKNALAQLKGALPKAIFIFDCIARYKLLGQRIGEEIDAIRQVLGKKVPLIGFYTYGEQAPLGGRVAPECHSVFHNETMALLVLGE